MEYSYSILLQIISEFNSVVSKIRCDLSTLTQFACIGFDGLPARLQSVLVSIKDKEMPQPWGRLISGNSFNTLNEGVEGK